MIRNEKFDVLPKIVRGLFKRGYYGITVTQLLNEARGETRTVMRTTLDFDFMGGSNEPHEIFRMSRQIDGIIPEESSPTRLYRLPKIHKQTVPLRPTVNLIVSPKYELAKYLSNILRKFTRKTSSG